MNFSSAVRDPQLDQIVPEAAPVAYDSSKMVGRFRLLSLLGVGSLGPVMRAEDTQLKRHVAIKLLPDADRETFRSPQFVQEARAAALLEHPNIVKIYEVGVDAGQHFIAMELMDGGSLARLVKEFGAFDLQRACIIGAEAAEALHFAAASGIIHRGVKPENLMLSRFGHCKLADFGLASVNDPTEEFAMPADVLGSVDYLAPEIINGNPATPASDIYSLAGVIYLLLTAQRPFPLKSRRDVLNAHVCDPAPDVRVLAPHVPEKLATLLLQAMSKDPAARPTADKLACVLRIFTITPGSQNHSLLPEKPTPLHPAGHAAASPLVSKRSSSLRWYRHPAALIAYGLVSGAAIVTLASHL